MGIREALRSRLTSHTGVSNLVGNRIYPNALPQNPTLPAIVYQRISTRRYVTHEDTPGSGRLARPRIQLTSWAEDPDAASEVADQVLAALSGLKQTIDGVRIDAVIPQEGDRDDREPDTDRYRRIVDVFAFHTE